MILRTKSVLQIIIRNRSALYITGDKATENYAVLTPYFDFHNKLKNREALEENISHRNLKLNLPQLYQLWDVYKDITNKKINLEKKRIEISEAIKRIDVQTNNEDLIRKYKNEGILAREDLKLLKENSYAVEDKFIQEYLMLPNELHEQTPLIECKCVFTNGEPSIMQTPSESHLTYTDYIEYYDRHCYYLRKDAAKFDLLFPFYVLNIFKQNKFTHFANPDFIKSILAEAAGLSTEQIITIKEDTIENQLNMLHLVGSGTMLSYLGFIAKLTIPANVLPLQFISTGKQYELNKNKDIGLYSATQSTVVQLFIAATKLDVQDKFDETLKDIINLYKIFGTHFRVVYVPASQLNPAECLRVNFEMYSQHLKQYVTVGHLCSYSDYISKRLLFIYTEDRKYRFPHLISGTVINVSTVLAILLENNKTFELLKFLKRDYN